MKRYWVSPFYGYEVNPIGRSISSMFTLYSYDVAYFHQRKRLIEHYTKELETCPKPHKKKLYAKIRKHRKTNERLIKNSPELFI